MNDWILPYLKRYKGRVSLAVLFAVLGVASGAMLLFVSGYLISKSALRPENIMMVYVPIVSVRAFSIGQAIFPYFEKLVSHDIVLRILASYRDRLYAMVEPQAIFLESRFRTGDLLSVLSDDIEKLQDFYIRTLLPALLGLVVYGVFSLVLGFFDLPFMLMMLLLLGTMVFLAPWMSYRLLRKKHLARRETRAGLYQQITDAMYGQLDWLVSGRVGEILAQSADTNESLLQKEQTLERLAHIREAALRFIAGLAIIAMMYWSGMQVEDGAFAATVIAAFILMMFSVTDALIPVSKAVEEVPTYTESLVRMEKIKAAGSITEEDFSKPGVSNGMEQTGNEVHQMKQEGWQDAVLHLDKVSYGYEDATEATIRDLSLTVPPGEKLAVLGKSGTGKSTLLKLIAGVIAPDAGTILVNGSMMNQHYLASAVSVLNQKPHLFHTTIANNIRIGKPSATDEEILAVLKQAQIDELVEQLPDGIHTQMDEMGKRFSGGERQRIAFARVLLQDTPIILLDEPTTGLDPRTERELLETMLTAAADKTIIWVTHHLAGAEWMDDIIFMEDGGIKLHGSHAKLMEESSYYRTLYEMDEEM